MIGACVIAPRNLLCDHLRAAGPAAQSPCLAASREGEDPMSVSDLNLSTDDLIALSDQRLVELIYEALCELDDGGTFYGLVDELVERTHPELARADAIRMHQDHGDANDVLDSLESLRRRQAARLLRDTFRDDAS
jgi:hypothetical protein